jgi:hypothetical protein
MSSLTYHLVVVRPFGSYAKGAIITDPKEIASILASEHASKVVRVAGTRS